MATIYMEEECLAPKTHLEVNYKGPDPFKAYKACVGIVRRIFEVETKDVWEREFRWDFSGDPREFLAKIFVVKGLDKFTKLIVEVFIHGHQPSNPNGVGDVKIKISGVLRITWPEKTFFHKTPIYKGLMWLYFQHFYKDVHKMYLELCRRNLERVKEAFLQLLKIAPQEAK